MKKKEELTKGIKKAICMFLAVIMAFGSFVALSVGSSHLQDYLHVKSMLSAYASEIVDTKGVCGINSDAMLADNTVIDLKNLDGSNTVYLFCEPISFTDENGSIKTKDISVEKQCDNDLLSHGYDYANGQNDYRINFSQDITKGLLIEFENCKYSIVPQTDYPAAQGKKSSSVLLGEKFETFEYSGAFGAGTNLKFYPQLNGVKDEIVLNTNTGKNTFSFELKTENCDAVLNDDGTVSLMGRDDSSIVQTFSAPFAYDSKYIEGVKDKHYIDCSYQLDKTDDNTYIMTVTADKSWLESPDTSYPVVIDPVTSHIGNMYDLPIHTKRTTAGATVDNNAVGTSAEYGTSRSLIKFQKPSEIKSHAAINSAYYWTRELTGRTSSFKCGIYKITSSWNENSLWSTRPSYSTSLITSRNINSASTDAQNNPYWYKFNIKNLVQQWYTGTTNYGFMMKYEDEGNTTKNLRTFAQLEYGTSAWRPYTVINYTNDETPPTAASVTGNPTDWTKNNVTITVNGAKDNSGGIGLHSAAYSFSTVSGSYSWQADNKKTFSKNCTVYVCIRDAYNNIKYLGKQTISKIDKTPPVVKSISGNPDKWTKNNVTLTVNGANDTQSGLHTTAYSFSTVKDSYSWQASNTKTFSQNQTVYIYTRDAVGNCTLSSTVNINKIDKTAPSKPTVTGNTDDWTNGDIELTAQSTDSQSGIAAYSFSYEREQYNWQTKNTYTESEKNKLYIYSKDHAGNISVPTEIDLKIDKLSPIGSVNTNVSDNWVKQLTITANASDNMSGLHEMPYSFSTAENEYNWQSENKKTITENGIYYIYARDAMNNIVLLDTVTIDKIDNSAPVIKNITVNENNSIITVHADAEDVQSGIAAYSFDGGKTWQQNSTFEVQQNALNYIAVQVKDNLGNISHTKYYDLYTPEIYYENDKVGLYNPNRDCDCDMYYKLSQSSAWLKYDMPIVINEYDELYISFYPDNSAAQQPIDVDLPEKNFMAYNETKTDLTLTYNNASFSIGRKYTDEKWDYSLNSFLTISENDHFIEVKMPDFNKYTFVKLNKYLYINEAGQYTLSVVYDETDTHINEYIVGQNKLSYHFTADGVLHKISNARGDLFFFTYEEDQIRIRDGANRETVITYDKHKITSITDPAGGVIHYNYDGENLVKVTDQSGAVTGIYAYDNHNLVKNGYTKIERDSNNGVSRLVNDNGYYVDYNYDGYYLTTASPDGKESKVGIDNFVLETFDDDGNSIMYLYDNSNRVELICINGTDDYIYSYDQQNRLVYKEDKDWDFSYIYDENGNLVREGKISKTDENSVYTYYVYDEYNQVVTKAELIDDGSVNITDEYNIDTNYTSVVKYEYNNLGLLSKTEDVDSGTLSTYLYDDYGNVIKSTATVTTEEKISVNITENTYDILNRLTHTKSDDTDISYIYDAAGRTLLINSDGTYQRTVYDSLGRTIQEIDNSTYNPELDNLPGAYGDTSAGQRYEYDSAGNLIREINKYDIETLYRYSDKGTLRQKHFDIYDYDYLPNGSCDKISVNGKTIVDYDYDVANNQIEIGEGQKLNRISFADGYTEEQLVDDKNNVYAKYVKNKAYYAIGSKSKDEIVVLDHDINYRSYLTSSENGYNFKQEKGSMLSVFSFNVKSVDDVQTISETHFINESYQSVIKDDSITFTTPYSEIVYSTAGDDNTTSELIKSNTETVLSSNISYDNESDTFKKLYADNGISFTNTYDSKGNIAADENNQYTYNDYGELIATSGNVNASYSYDGRGNMLSRTVNGETTRFTYGNAEWQDQLTGVNDTALTYDANGNMTAYGDIQYTWSYGKRLASIKDSENTYSYKYDENGIRTQSD